MTARRRFAALLFVSIALAGCGLGGPATPSDSGVRGTPGGEFIWAVDAPTLAISPIDPEAARASVDAALALSDDEADQAFPITIVAVFGTADEAETSAAEVRTILEDGAAWYADAAHAADREALDDVVRFAPMIPPDAAAMKRHLLAAGSRGVGWGGEPGEAETAVYTLGPLLFVTGMESDANPNDLDAPLHPLAHLLAAGGADVMLEGDRFGEGSIMADLSC